MVTVTGMFLLPDGTPDSGSVRLAVASPAVLRDADPALVTAAEVVYHGDAVVRRMKETTFRLMIAAIATGSSAQFKSHIADPVDSPDVTVLRPREFRWTDDDEMRHRTHPGMRYGLIAEEVAAVDERFVMRDFDDNVVGLDQHALIAALIAKVTELEQRIDRMQETARESLRSYLLRAGLLRGVHPRTGIGLRCLPGHRLVLPEVLPGPARQQLPPLLSEPLSPPAVDPDDTDKPDGTGNNIGAYPDASWGDPYFSRYLTDFYETTYGKISLDPTLGSDFFYNLVTWRVPSGEWTGLRLVRRQYGPPETVDDGVCVLFTESYTTQREFVEVRPQGDISYYGVFIRLKGGEWRSAGYAQAVNCRNHDGLEEFVNSVPRVYTSSTGGMLDAPDRDRGDLCRFLQGFGFEYDLWKTQADRLYDHPGNIPWAAAASWAKQFGLSDLDIYTIGERNLRKWLMAAASCYQQKGTMTGLTTLASAISGWPVTATVSPNIMLDTDDSSAENSTGRWVVAGGQLDRIALGPSLASAVTQGLITDSVAGSPHLQDYAFRVVPSAGTATLELGLDDVMHAVPVTVGTAYAMNLCWKALAASGTLTVGYTWLKIDGTQIAGSTGSAATATTSWAQTATVTTVAAPTGAAFLGITLTIAGSSTYYLDMMQVTLSGGITAGTFSDARSVDLRIAPARTNLCLNPSFDIGTSGWTSGTQEPEGLLGVGATVFCLRATAETSTTTAPGSLKPRIPVTASVHVKPFFKGSWTWSSGTLVVTTQSAHGLVAGAQVPLVFAAHPLSSRTYIVASPTATTFTVAMATPGAGSGTLTIGYADLNLPVTVECLNSAGTVLSTTQEVFVVDTDTWTRIGLTNHSCPEGTDKVRVKVAGSGTSGLLASSGGGVDIDGCLIEVSDVVQSYFDATTYNNSGSSYWKGAAFVSESLLYPQRMARQPVLARLLEDAVPDPVYVRVVPV